MKRHAPATERNREPIGDILQSRLPSEGTILEIASGTGQHAIYMAERFSHITWQPSETSPDNIASIKAWALEVNLPNLNTPLELDVNKTPWPINSADAIFCANMIHISPWHSCICLLEGAAKVLTPGAKLFLYGPFLVDGQPTSESNKEFDLSLRSRNTQWGLRDVNHVRLEAEKNGFSMQEMLPMPANNFTVTFKFGN